MLNYLSFENATLIPIKINTIPENLSINPLILLFSLILAENRFMESANMQ